MNEDTADAVSKALRRAWQLGQTYWQQADSDSYKQNARSEQTKAMFMDLVLETRATMTQAGAMVAAERERCARLCESMDFGETPSDYAWAIRTEWASDDDEPATSEPLT